MDKLQVLIVSKGHFYNHDAFLAMFEAMEDIETTLVEQPAAQVMLRPDNVGAYDAVLFYDMSGIPGAGLTHDLASEAGQPTADYRRSMEALIERGTGIVLLNHAAVSWPEWPLWRAITGSSFMLTAGELNGKQVPGSGYRGGHGPHPNATVKVLPQAQHPVLEGLEMGFEVTDELYLKTADFESKVLPLMRAEYDFVVENFSPPPLAPEQEQASWTHQPGSNLVVWAHSAEASPVVVSELGDGPAAFDHPGFRRLLHNALRWTASAEGRAWAAQQRG